VAAAAPVRARPDAAAPDVGVVAQAVAAPVYGRFGSYVLVEVDGRRGWLETGVE
jgi:hypothetical protein